MQSLSMYILSDCNSPHKLEGVIGTILYSGLLLYYLVREH